MYLVKKVVQLDLRQMRNFWAWCMINENLIPEYRVIMVVSDYILLLFFISTILPNCYAIPPQFSIALAESGRQWNNQIIVNKTYSLTRWVTLKIHAIFSQNISHLKVNDHALDMSYSLTISSRLSNVNGPSSGSSLLSQVHEVGSSPSQIVLSGNSFFRAFRR